MTRICAHAGIDGTIPNSLESLELASLRGYDVVEFDITRYGEKLVLAHDIEARFETEPPPLLAGGLALLKNRDITVNCDIKEPSMTPEVSALIKEFGMEDKAFFTGEIAPDFESLTPYKFFLNADNPCLDIPPRIGLTEAEKLAGFFRNSGNSNFLGYNFDYLVLAPEGLALFLNENIPFILWTVDDEALIPGYIDKGIWGLTTNKTRFALEYRNSALRSPEQFSGL
ncbi:MAG: glycerophosphodiester phosphodiesterase [Spirochaetaceae bacterium]|jgi:glycerophosphoryl diester phosphodiesterase|nr:glycerophosphodiester phosphodiesterase [Spirochaetaceae bacterium]